MARQDRQLRRRPEGVASPGSTRGTLLRGPALVSAFGLGAATLLFVRDPHVAGSYGFCPFQLLTGLYCPGCGGTRAAYDVLHLDFGAAISSNVLAVALMATLIVAFALWVLRRWRGNNARMIVLPAKVGVLVMVALLIFAVVRNTPWGAWLAP